MTNFQSTAKNQQFYANWVLLFLTMFRPKFIIPVALQDKTQIRKYVWQDVRDGECHLRLKQQSSGINMLSTNSSAVDLLMSFDENAYTENNKQQMTMNKKWFTHIEHVDKKITLFGKPGLFLSAER